jgi:hypothetical protein
MMKRMQAEEHAYAPYDGRACLCRRMMEERMPMPPYDPRMPMPPYDPRTGGVGKPIDDLPPLPPTDIGYDPRPPMDDRPRMMPPMMPPMDERMPRVMTLGLQ